MRILPVIIAFVVVGIARLAFQTFGDSQHTNIEPRKNEPPSKFYQLIIAPNGSDKKLSVDAYGVFTNGNGDTLAVSCELSDIFCWQLQQYFTVKTPTVDSAYQYRQQVEFYRQWFGDNITPDPLKPKREFKEN